VLSGRMYQVRADAEQDTARITAVSRKMAGVKSRTSRLGSIAQRVRNYIRNHQIATSLRFSQ
jgi:hypothetical protein